MRCSSPKGTVLSVCSSRRANSVCSLPENGNAKLLCHPMDFRCSCLRVQKRWSSQEMLSALWVRRWTAGVNYVECHDKFVLLFGTDGFDGEVVNFSWVWNIRAKALHLLVLDKPTRRPRKRPQKTTDIHVGFRVMPFSARPCQNTSIQRGHSAGVAWLHSRIQSSTSASQPNFLSRSALCSTVMALHTAIDSHYPLVLNKIDLCCDADIQLTDCLGNFQD